MQPSSPRAQPPVTRGQPFVAEFRYYKRGTRDVLSSGRMFRDVSGRTRIDYELGEGVAIRILDDAPALTVIFLDMNKRLSLRERYEKSVDAWSFRGAAAVRTTDRVELQGVECVRVDLNPLGQVPAAGDLGNTWISPSKGIVMRDDNPREGWTWEITKIDFREPSPETFHVPADFQEME